MNREEYDYNLEELNRAEELMNEAIGVVKDIFSDDSYVQAYWIEQVENHVEGINPYDCNFDKLRKMLEDKIEEGDESEDDEMPEEDEDGL